jgi:hypothetical protein
MSLMLLLRVDLNALNALDNNLIFSIVFLFAFLGDDDDGISSLILIITASEADTSAEGASFV